MTGASGTHQVARIKGGRLDERGSGAATNNLPPGDRTTAALLQDPTHCSHPFQAAPTVRRRRVRAHYECVELLRGGGGKGRPPRGALVQDAPQGPQVGGCSRPRGGGWGDGGGGGGGGGAKNSARWVARRGGKRASTERRACSTASPGRPSDSTPSACRAAAAPAWQRTGRVQPRRAHNLWRQVIGGSLQGHTGGHRCTAGRTGGGRRRHTGGHRCPGHYPVKSPRRPVWRVCVVSCGGCDQSQPGIV